MPLTDKQITNAFKKFEKLRKSEHRYVSFDYCYNYFRSFNRKDEIILPENLEKSCLVLGFYLASWGMFRNSDLMQKSLYFYIPIVQWIASCPKKLWEIDVDKYNDENIKLLIETYDVLDEIFKGINKNRRTLITKLMLGVFGNVPALDSYFRKTFKEKYGDLSKFSKIDEATLLAIKRFYENKAPKIDYMRNQSKIYNFDSGSQTETVYPIAKIIDMIGFGHSFRKKKK